MSDLDTLKLKVDVQGRLIRLLSRRREEQTFTAAHLLAHQQARALEWRSVADADERVGIGVYRRSWSREIDRHDATRAERDTLRAENDLRGAQLLMIGSTLEGDPKLGPDDTQDPRWTPTLRAASNLRAENKKLKADQEQGAKDYLDLRDHADAQSVRAQSAEAERDTLRAENKRLNRANVDLVAQASSREHERKQLREALADVARCGLGLDLFDADLADRIRAALGEEVREHERREKAEREGRS